MDNIFHHEHISHERFDESKNQFVLIRGTYKLLKNKHHINRTTYVSKDFIENGVNVNFVCVSVNSIRMRTYERGVEDETLSCGTGVTAAVIAAVFAGKISDNLKEVKVVTQGGELSVLFERGIDNFYNVRLNGPAKKVFEGVINL
jgi:diaminopimelate epimerase